MRYYRAALGLALAQIVLSSEVGWAQYRPAPQSSQLRTDPVVGNIQGIYRFGRTMKTDPDEGEGYSYQVYQSPGIGGAVAATGATGAQCESQGNVKSPQAVVAAGFYTPVAANPAFQPFDATAGMRNQYPGVSGYQNQNYVAQAFGNSLVQAYTENKDPTNPHIDLPNLGSMSHQPLIQVKVRVVEVQRTGSFQASSILDFIRSNPSSAKSTYFGTGFKNTLNGGKQNFAGGSRFPTDPITGVSTGLLGIDSSTTALSTTGSGLLVNLTSKNINYIASLLATDFHGDLITAPEVVTLNGQNVEFVAGSKVPFALGQTVVKEGSANIQQYFYKHVGTFISVTPQIVNWGVNHEGLGKVRANYATMKELAYQPLTPGDVLNWYELCNQIISNPNFFPKNSIFQNPDVTKDWLSKISQPETQQKILLELNYLLGSDRPKCNSANESPKYDRFLLCGQNNLTALAPPSTANCGHCNWNANDCTIDLAIVVRLSDTGTSTVSAPGSTVQTGANNLSTETDIRAISNIVQVKSGNGVVMAGLIGNRDEQAVSKVPVLGDIPVAGFLFRSKSTVRSKVETLIFVEAQVLPSCPADARVISYEDFLLSEHYVCGEFLDNPLEYGMYRAGFGTYLPPCSHEEKVYWEQFGRTMRRTCTEVGDAFKGY